MGSKAN
jgi:hypothetical protein